MVKSIIIQINLNAKAFTAFRMCFSFLQEIITQSFGTAFNLGHFLFVNRIGFQNDITFQFEENLSTCSSLTS